LAMYRNNGRSGFTRFADAALNESLTRAQTTLLGWKRTDGRSALLVGSSNYEDGLTNGSVAHQYAIAKTSVRREEPLPGSNAATGPMALADVDGDGELDLFVG